MTTQELHALINTVLELPSDDHISNCAYLDVQAERCRRILAAFAHPHTLRPYTAVAPDVHRYLDDAFRDGFHEALAAAAARLHRLADDLAGS